MDLLNHILLTIRKDHNIIGLISSINLLLHMGVPIGFRSRRLFRFRSVLESYLSIGAKMSSQK